MDFTASIASTIIRPTAEKPKPNAQIKRTPAAGSRFGAKSWVQMLAKTSAAESNVGAEKMIDSTAPTPKISHLKATLQSPAQPAGPFPAR